jgi:hypothetical protein
MPRSHVFGSSRNGPRSYALPATEVALADNQTIPGEATNVLNAGAGCDFGSSHANYRNADGTGGSSVLSAAWGWAQPALG